MAVLSLVDTNWFSLFPTAFKSLEDALSAGHVCIMSGVFFLAGLHQVKKRREKPKSQISSWQAGHRTCFVDFACEKAQACAHRFQNSGPLESQHKLTLGATRITKLKAIK